MIDLLCSFGANVNAEDILYGDVDRFPHAPAVPSNGFYSRCPFSITNLFVPDDIAASSCTLGHPGESFQVPERKLKRPTEIFSESTSSEIVETNGRIHSFPYGLSIFQGLMRLPVFGLRFARKLTFACWRCFLSYVSCIQVEVQSFVSRVHITLKGSSDDIGWLWQTPGVAPVEDGTTRFMELLQRVRKGKHTLPNSFVYLLVPGILSNLCPLYFVSTKKYFSKMGLACHIAKIHSEAAVEHNALELKQYIEELHWGSGKRVMLLGHSKGGIDAAAALSIYPSELKGKVAGLALVQAPYGGNLIASDLLREGQIAYKESRKILEMIRNFVKGDMRSVEDLTYKNRKEFIMKYKHPEHIPIISFVSETSIGPSVLAALSHVAHVEIPWCPFPSFGKVPVLIPSAAIMAVYALHHKLRYGERSDGAVTCCDAVVPGSVVVHPAALKLDHTWMAHAAYSWQPDSSRICESLLTLLVEIGKMKHEQGESKE